MGFQDLTERVTQPLRPDFPGLTPPSGVFTMTAGQHPARPFPCHASSSSGKFLAQVREGGIELIISIQRSCKTASGQHLTIAPLTCWMPPASRRIRPSMVLPIRGWKSIHESIWRWCRIQRRPADRSLSAGTAPSADLLHPGPAHRRALWCAAPFDRPARPWPCLDATRPWLIRCLLRPGRIIFVRRRPLRLPSASWLASTAWIQIERAWNSADSRSGNLAIQNPTARRLFPGRSPRHLPGQSRSECC